MKRVSHSSGSLERSRCSRHPTGTRTSWTLITTFPCSTLRRSRHRCRRIHPPSAGGSPQPSGGRPLHGDGSDNDSSSSEHKVHIPPSHNLAQFPSCSTCPVCSRAKAQTTPHRRKANTDNASLDDQQRATPACFGDLVAADHVVQGSFQESSWGGDTTTYCFFSPRIMRRSGLCVCVCVSLAPTKSANDTMMGLIHIVGASDTVGRLYTDGSGELSLAAQNLLWGHDVSTPQRPQSNGVAGQAARRVFEGARSLLLQPGLPHPCWAMLRMHVALSGKQSAMLMETDTIFSGTALTSEASSYLLARPSNTSQHRSRTSDAQKLSPGVVRGMFAGYHYHSGGERSGDYFVHDENSLRSATAWHYVHLRASSRERVHIPHKY